jgi:hypothetical protein
MTGCAQDDRRARDVEIRLSSFDSEHKPTRK